MTKNDETNEHKNDCFTDGKQTAKEDIWMTIPPEIPIIEFRDLNHAACLLKEWQDRLGLSEWVIKIFLYEPHEMDDEEHLGECEYRAFSKCASIRILKSKYCGNGVIKACAEQTLIHELLHLSFAVVNTDNDVFELLTHQIIEDLANALICAKYDIEREWFNNIKY